MGLNCLCPLAGVQPCIVWVAGPMSRFGDTAANAGTLALLDSYESTVSLPVSMFISPHGCCLKAKAMSYQAAVSIDLSDGSEHLPP